MALANGDKAAACSVVVAVAAVLGLVAYGPYTPDKQAADVTATTTTTTSIVQTTMPETGEGKESVAISDDLSLSDAVNSSSSSDGTVVANLQPLPGPI